jgi:hypothetical protein
VTTAVNHLLQVNMVFGGGEEKQYEMGEGTAVSRARKNF